MRVNARTQLATDLSIAFDHKYWNEIVGLKPSRYFAHI